MIIDRRCVSIMSMLVTNHRMKHLRIVDTFEWIRNTGRNIRHHRDSFEKYQNCFEVNHRNCFGYNIGTMQGDICQCLLINIINKY
jgi:hypothetical protein